MLQQLKINQFVIIDQSEMRFKSKLTIFTGETGAGKSIILGAMDLILGGAANTKSIRQGHDSSSFDAVFAPNKQNPVWALLLKNQLVAETDTEFTIHRTIYMDDRSQIQLNGKDITLDLLKEIGEHLIEIHGQHANQNLLGPDNQLNLLDRFGNFDQKYYDNVATALDDVFRLQQEMREEKNFLAKYKGPKGQKLAKIYKRFESINMKEGYSLEIHRDYTKLMTAKNTLETFQDIMGRFIASSGITNALGGAKATLERQENLDQEKVAALKQHIDASLTEARKVVTEVSRLLPDYEIDLTPLTELKKIYLTLSTIAQEANIDYDDLESFYKTVYEKVDRIRNGRERLKEIDNKLAQAKNSYREHSHILTEKRIEAGKKMSAEITAEFIPLMLNKAQFEIEVEEDINMEWTARGFNKVTFVARMNPGMPFSPISETASGGEMARMILALKVVIQQSQTISTLVFDEVDVGIGGAAAAAVGDRIAALADLVQVVVITHSPQVASRGDQHLHITKRSEGEKTISSVNELSQEQRVEEISRMLAGGELTDHSFEAAKSLIAEAEKSTAARQTVN